MRVLKDGPRLGEVPTQRLDEQVVLLVDSEELALILSCLHELGGVRALSGRTDRDKALAWYMMREIERKA